MGIIIGAFAGGMCFFAFGLMRTVHTGGFLTVVVLSKLKGRPIEQSLFVRIMVAAGVMLSIFLGIAVSMVLGGTVGVVIEYALTKMTWNLGGRYGII